MFLALLPKSLLCTKLGFCVGIGKPQFLDLWELSRLLHFPSFSDSPFHITPSRLQLFEYESVYFTCEGVNISAELKVRNIRQVLSKCSNSTVMKRCGIKYALASDSGEYWCESEAERSNAVSITVSGMLLSELTCKTESSGDAVTLHCRNRKTSSNFTADFYKDNFFMGTRYEGKLEIQKVLMSHEGLYKCKIHGVGESPESWVAIRRKSNAGEGMVFLFIYLFGSICKFIITEHPMDEFVITEHPRFQ
uniref:Ig-like domain-containing protein n=1 Tax=Haplochromis burtoni TaxID=8153 RepID=A0A3Q2VHH8_HAPBU